MNTRRLMIVLTAVVLIAALALALNTGSSVVATDQPVAGVAASNKVALDNVRDYAAAPANGMAYAIDGGLLYAGRPLDWQRVPTPQGVIVGAVAVDSKNPANVYIGAANELAVYRTTDGGQNWLYTPLTQDYIGGVKDIAVDAENHLIYVGTDTAGLFRLRDVGSSLTDGGHYRVDAPIVEVAADSTGAGMAFFRTQNALFRSENGGMSWSPVETLSSVPTALAVANSKPPVVYVGTTDRGLLRSDEGIAWMSANDGLGMVPGSRLQVDALAVDPQEPSRLYVATSYLYGSTELHQTSTGVHMSANGGDEWAPIVRTTDVPAAGLLPVAGESGAVYMVSNASRSPLALGVAPVASKVQAPAPVPGRFDWAGAAAAWLAAIAAGAWMGILLAAELRKQPAAQAQPARVLVRTNR